MTSGTPHNQIYTTDQRHTPRCLTTCRVATRRRKNGPCGASPLYPFAGVSSSLASAIARGRMGSPARVSAARTQSQLVQPALDSAAREAAPGPSGRVEGAIAPRASGERPETPGLNPICQGVGPWVVRLRNHNAYPTSARPACRDGGTFPFLSFRVEFNRNQENEGARA